MCWDRASDSSIVLLLTFDKEPPNQQPHDRRASQQLLAQGACVSANLLHHTVQSQVQLIKGLIKDVVPR